MRGADHTEHRALMYFRLDTIYCLGFMNADGTERYLVDVVNKIPKPGCTLLCFSSGCKSSPILATQRVGPIKFGRRVNRNKINLY